MDKQRVIYPYTGILLGIKNTTWHPYNGILLGNTKEQTTNTITWMNLKDKNVSLKQFHSV